MQQNLKNWIQYGEKIIFKHPLIDAFEAFIAEQQFDNTYMYTLPEFIV